ncbi:MULTISPECIES: circularly permuted type 2 ATP-grasp protein [unclassified Vibrio]|uniref:Circularly permuted type 2 ATP-grasp protein n=1 Tax=Vibrio sp. HB236076 TaxID=3232307 RepID=A0AB39HES3_9VIBR|nr:circularly permuted type 2 ATP-grasp protein [Vibrio sp. HB161653]MDP5253853.1 circularly permuted type 2 ATP-grasp protein [Vibrio sp. HB161653]
MTTSPIIYPYHAPMGAFDEVFDLHQQILPHWQGMFTHLSLIKERGIEELHLRAQKILRDDGATYDLKNDPLSPEVWSLDVIPNVIDAQQWAHVEQGLVQRSELFNLVLKDIYGEQRLIREGIIPPEVVFGHPDYLRQCHGVEVPGEKQLLLHAIDLVRNINGQFLAISDQTQVPSGIGYALENRTVISRVLPSVFRRSNVKRLSSFFHTLKNTLNQLAADKTDDPKIVILTQGTSSNTYFEQAYLANYLGYSLVQGSDLTVRNGQLWLKTLDGLSQVDVVLRRTDDKDCDQLELSADSAYGVPGLMEVVRNGQVILANPIGSAVLEAPALIAYLPTICEYLLKQPLLLPTVNSYWCGEANSLDYVLQNIDSLVIKPAFRRAQRESIFVRHCSPEEKNTLIASIKATPAQFVAQEYVPGSIVPVWENQQIERRPSLLRTFTVVKNDTYVVMPGGLSRVAKTEKDYFITRLSGTWSKDTWICADKPDKTHQSMLDEDNLKEVQLGHIPSRVVENFFWLGRYAERAELCTRFMRVVFKQMNGIELLETTSRDVLLTAFSKQTNCLPGFLEPSGDLLEEPDGELADLVVNANRIGSIKSNLLAMLTCAEQVKERLSADTRIILNKLRDDLGRLDKTYKSGLPEVPEDSLDDIVTVLLALSGLSSESMLRGQDWIFLQIGLRTERAIQTAKLLQSTLTTSLERYAQKQVLESVLLSVEALISFRRRYRNKTQVQFALDLLMVDSSNPRSLVYQIERLNEFLTLLPNNQASVPGGLTAEKRLILKTLSDIQLSDLERLSKTHAPTKVREKLTDFLAQLIEQLEQFTSIISDKYFDHTAGPQQLNKPKWKLDV